MRSAVAVLPGVSVSSPISTFWLCLRVHPMLRTTCQAFFYQVKLEAEAETSITYKLSPSLSDVIV